MDMRGNGLLRVLLDVYQNRLPNFIHLTRDRLWVSDLALQDSGGTALTLQCFDLDGRECLHKVLYHMEAECPAPYCWFTDNAVVLFHAPEDPADRGEVTTITLRWFPLDALEEQVWRVGPEQLPGELTGVIRHWTQGEVLTVQGTFLTGDDVRTACMEFDLTHRRISVGKLCPPGSPAIAYPPEDDPDMEALTVHHDLAEMLYHSFSLPNEMCIAPTHIWADAERYKVELMVFPSADFETADCGRTMLFTGRHCGYLAPLTIEGYPYILLLRQPLFLPCMELDFPSPFQGASDAPLRLIRGNVLEADRAFADAHLSQFCRDDALFHDDACYRWRLDHAAWEVIFELPAFFFEPDIHSLKERMLWFCAPYLSRSGISDTTFFTSLEGVYQTNIKQSRALLANMRANASKVEPLHLPIASTPALPEM